MRWSPDARGRLKEAALGLFAEQGYAATTVPQITERAGLTTRTFFRYFADKREVIFDGDEIPDTAAGLIAAAPAALEPLEVIRHVLHEVARDRFEENRAEVAAWRVMIDANGELRDRDARKRADMARSARDAFITRGQAPLQARVVAEVGVLAFHIALDEWARDDDARSMSVIVDDILALIGQEAGCDEHIHR